MNTRKKETVSELPFPSTAVDGHHMDMEGGQGLS